MNAQLEQWLARAHTPQTRARIRRWALLRRVFCVVTIVSGCAFVASLVTAVVLWSLGTDAAWMPPAAVGLVIIAASALALSSFRLDTARFADGVELIGVITDVEVDLGAEGTPAYLMTIQAQVPGGASIRRVTREYAVRDPQAGQSVRFRHNTSDPDDEEDILFVDVVTPPEPREGDTL